MNEPSLYEQLQKYAESDHYPYHMPGHKRMQLGKMPASVLNIDITEIDGFDNLHQPEGILLRLQERANVLYGAEETFYLVNGSTGGILSAISAVLPKGGHLLMARDSHKSAYHAVYLRELQVSYLYPQRMKQFEIADAVTPEQIEESLANEKDVGAVFIVSPTYEGRIADIRGIADVVHKRGIPLIVDEAHGAHLGFGEGFAEGSCRLGADLVIHSVHKTLPAMTQTALLHVGGKRIDRDRLKRFLRIYQSSSPSYVLMASIGDAMEIIENSGKEKFAFLREQYRQLLNRLQSCKTLQFVPWQDIEEGKQDIGKLVIASGREDVSGQWIYDTLQKKYHLPCEMAAGSYCLAMFTMADTKEAYDRMADALLEIDGQLEDMRHGNTSCAYVREKTNNSGDRDENRRDMPQQAFSLATAWDMPWKMTKLSEAIERPIADFVNLYPPGIPLIVPGEILTRKLYEQILCFRKQNLNVQGLQKQADGDYIRVLLADK